MPPPGLQQEIRNRGVDEVEAAKDQGMNSDPTAAPIKWVIYGLIDPRNGEVRYVGWTTNLKRRMREHLTPKKRETDYKTNWVRNLRAEGLAPRVRVLEYGSGPYDAAEQFWISVYREAGVALTNLAIGGGGAVGVIKSLETRAKLSQALKGKKRPPEVGKKISDARLRIGQSDKQKEALKATSAANIGRKQPRSAVEARAKMARGKSWGTHSEEVKRMVSERFKGKPKSAETKAKISLSAKLRWRNAKGIFVSKGES